MEKYDLIIIGGGAGAFAAAIQANELSAQGGSASGGKAKTAMINAGLPLGGTCVNVGCVPSKALLWAGEVMHQAKNHNIPGIEIEVKKFDFAKVIQDELSLVERMREEKYSQVLAYLEHVTFIEGKAAFVSEHEVEVNGATIEGKKIIIATGSTATVLPIDGIREAGYLTHIEALKLKERPKSLIVIGGGPLGLEFSQMFTRFGTKVTLIEFNSRIMHTTEDVLSAQLAKVLQEEGIEIFTNAKVISARKEGDQKILVYEIDGERKEVTADEILLAAGKTPNTQELNLEASGVEINKRGAITVKPHFQTSQEHIYAIGEVANLPMRLETTAGREGTLVAGNALEDKKDTIDYNSVPYAVFTDPQLAGVGWTEEQQMEAMKTCLCRTVSFDNVPKAIIMQRTEGIIRMAVSPKDDAELGLKQGQILGIHILAPSASELIAEAMMLVKNKNTIDDVINSLPMFPTLSEAIKIAAISFKKDISKLSCCI